jgi:uncharacterized protein (TIGR02246 family)
MRRNALIAPIVALVFFSLASAAFAEPPAADPNRARIEKLGKQFADAFGKGDVAAVAAMYAEDAVAFPPESEVVKGRAAIEAMWKGTRDMGVQSIEFTVWDVQTSGILLVETGKATLTVAGAGPVPATVAVKYVVVWKKQKDGGWKISHDIWNALPAPAAAPTPAPAG